ncbi:hypothetical protein A6X20_24125 [Bradyrhizobium elkanii]|nr:hypothetical protein A6X20_24125 [Bradyrhizobium elkanii]ODM81404.1 hypothetical protein A6452_21900 [Bradyrhizobium elkanii]
MRGAIIITAGVLALALAISRGQQTGTGILPTQSLPPVIAPDNSGAALTEAGLLRKSINVTRLEAESFKLPSLFLRQFDIHNLRCPALWHLRENQRQGLIWLS